MVLLCNLFFYLFTIYFASIESDAYRILAIFPFNSRSHNNMFEGVTKALAKRGHQVDVITHFELKNPPKNYRTIINLAGTSEQQVNNWTMEKVSILENSDLAKILSEQFGNNICELMSLDKIQRFIQNPPNDPPYDLVITEACGTNCYIGFGYVLKVPVITISTTLEFSWADEAIGNPTSLAFSINLETNKAKISTFWDRLENTFLTHYNKYRFYKYTENAQTETMRKYLSPDIPNIREVERSVALTFVNTYHSLFGIRPTTPALVPLAGIHIEQNEAKFTPELKAWMDESNHGVVYFTLGSMVVIETLPKETLLTFYASFAKIAPVRVLMKIVNKEKLPTGLPNNVRTMSWIPQVPVLNHNNTRLFITHGGLNSIQEAIYHGIPMIGFPLFGDQILNVNIFTDKNITLKMDYKKISEKSLDEALNALLNDPKYREAAKRESRLFRDRPLNATDTANFWIEYIIRNGANSLRSPAVDLYWWQVELLDVYGFLIMCIFVIISIALFIFTNAIRIIVNILNYNSQLHKKKD